MLYAHNTNTMTTQRPAFRMALMAIVAIVLLTGCAAHNTPVNASPVSTAAPLYDPGPVTEYRLVPADNILIRYYGNEELDQAQPIRPDGKISLAYVGQVDAAGLTPAELENKLVELYTGELASPRINVIVQTHAPQRFYIGGEIGNKGTQDIHGTINLLQAIQLAGGLTAEARPGQVVLIRADADGMPTGRTFNLKQLQSGGGEAYNTVVRPNDVIYVPRAKIINFGTWVDRYIGGLVPNLPGFGFIVNDSLRDNNNNNTTTTTTTNGNGGGN